MTRQRVPSAEILQIVEAVGRTTVESTRLKRMGHPRRVGPGRRKGPPFPRGPLAVRPPQAGALRPKCHHHAIAVPDSAHRVRQKIEMLTYRFGRSLTSVASARISCSVRLSST